MRGIIGLANLGNTCYMNAAIQAFRNCPEWTLFMTTKDTLEEHISNDESKEKSVEVVRAYQDLVKSIWAGEGPAYIKPLGFFEQLKRVVKGTIYEFFIQRSPQDAHEFLVWLLDQMYLGTQKPVQIELPDPSHEHTFNSLQLEAFKAWKSNFEKQYSPLTDLLFGLLRVQYKCFNCHAVHTRWDTFNVFKIPLGKNPDGTPFTLQQSFEEELKDEVLDEFTCETCKGRYQATKTTTIWKLPKVLLVSLKRFTPMGTRDNRLIQYNNEPLNLQAFFSPESEEATKRKSFSLFATVDHHGHHMGGHYTAQAFSPVWKKWHLYDDETVHELKEPQFGVQTYIMMFR